MNASNKGGILNDRERIGSLPDHGSATEIIGTENSGASHFHGELGII
jgi:hypothetical protein